VTWWLALPALGAAVYYLLAVVAAIVFLRRKPVAARRSCEPVSILKPVHGRDPRFWEAIRSHAELDYPEFEILFGVSDPEDAALEEIARLQVEYPRVRIEAYVVATKAPNAKVGVLAELARRARHSLLLVNDSDIVVDRDYLRVVTAPLADPAVGLVTCLYRAEAESLASRAEALGVATEFAPGVLVARLLGNGEFALGSTMAFRASVLRSFGGFPAMADYLADDYQLGRRIHDQGLRIEFASAVVATHLGGESWLQTWRHQVRWSRTIRVSRPLGYYGYIVTHATVWAIVSLLAGFPWIAAAAFGLRLAAGILVGGLVLRDRSVLRHFWWIPARDLFGFAVWVAGAAGNHVQWRDRRLRLRPDGRIYQDHFPGAYDRPAHPTPVVETAKKHN
jgi:ceramide glucosyltransferase